MDEYFLAGRASQEEGVNANRDAGRPAPRGFIERIEIPPDGLSQVVGRFGEMLTAASDGAVTAAVGSLVAGACNPLNLELSWAAA